MKALEDHEDPVAVLSLYPDPVVADRELKEAVEPPDAEVDPQRHVQPGEFDRVTDEECRDLLELHRVGHDHRHRVVV